MPDAGQIARGVPDAAGGSAPAGRGRPAARQLRLNTDDGGELSADAFAARLDPLGPFEPRPRLAVAVSGGADSLALAILAAQWAEGCGGGVVGLVVDHGLRAESAAEAALTAARLAGLGIAARVLTLAVAAGTRLAERARAARHAALEAACAQSGILHLLFGHHAADQAETVAMRRLRHSRPAGLAGMAALTETDQVRKLRPLLDVAPVRLRRILMAAGVAWIEDPSNADPAAERARLRRLSRDRDGDGPLIRAAVAASQARGRARHTAERAVADWLGRHVTIFPTGYALMAGDAPVPPAALAALVATIGGRAYPPPPAQVARWLETPRPATFGGVRILRERAGWLLARERAAMRPDGDGKWDGRFLPRGWADEALPDHLPACIDGTFPRAFADDGKPVLDGRFAPHRPLAQAAFVTAGAGMQKPVRPPI